MSLKLRQILLLTFIGAGHLAFSQGQGKSPYSSIGIGELTDETTASQDMMGGTGVSFTNTFYINGVNPALLAKDRVINGLKYVAFNVSGKGYFRNLQQGQDVAQDFGMNLSNLSMAFPVLPKWAIGVSFKPYSITENETQIRKPFDGSSSISSYTYTDYGGLSKVGLTNSVMLARGLYVGVEGQYYFGNITRDTTTHFMGDETYARYSVRHSLKGLSLKGGIAYQQKISKNWKLNVGGTYQLGNNVEGERINTFQQLVSSSNGLTTVTVPDTLAIGTTTASLPARYKLGLSLEKTYNWVFAAEYGLVDWEGISKPFDDKAKNVLRNSQEMNFGIEWVPNVSSSKYFNQVFYRIGFKSVTTPYYINNTHIKDNSVSAGFSLPLGKGASYLDLGASVGRRGTLSNNLVQENYIKISASFSMVRDWFHRPRIQ